MPMPASASLSLERLTAAIAQHRAERGADARVCFLLQPGGAAGAYQAGTLQALADHGVAPDLIVGTSAGALNGLGLLLDALSPLPPGAGAGPRTRLGRLWRRLSHRQGGAAMLVDKPCLVGWISGRPDWNRHWLGSLAAHAPHLGEDWAALQGGVFSAAPLKHLLASVIGGALGDRGRSPGHEAGAASAERAGHALAQAWAARAAAAQHPPTLVVTATRVGTHTAVPFVLGDPEVAHRLFDARRPVAMLGHEALVGEAVLDALLASCAIPGVFPPVELPMPTVSAPFRTFVDGAIANHEPLHLAIDAGATLIVSLEVSSRRMGPPAGGLPFPAIAAETFMTVQDRYYASDMREVARWNRLAAEGIAPDKQVVPVFRLAPHLREIGLLDFDGRWEDGVLVCSLYDWYMAGYADAGGTHRPLWDDYVVRGDRHGDTGWALLPRPPHAGFWEATVHPFAPALAEAPEPASPLPARVGGREAASC